MRTIVAIAVVALFAAPAAACPIAVSCGGGFVQQSSYSSVQVLAVPQAYYVPQVQVLAVPQCYSQVQVLSAPVVKQRVIVEQRVRQRVFQQRARVRSRSFSIQRSVVR